MTGRHVVSLPDAARSKLPTGDAFAQKLTAVSQMIAAASIAETVDVAPFPEDGVGILRLPQFGISRLDGKPFVNRISWAAQAAEPTRGGKRTTTSLVADGPAVRLVPVGEAVELSWSVKDSAAGDQAGVLTVSAEGAIGGELPELVAGTEPNLTSVFSAPTLSRRLERIVSIGNGEIVQLVRLLTPYTAHAVRAAGTRVYREISDDYDSRSVIDALEAEAITDRLLYGDENASSSVVTRMVRRVAATEAVVRKSLYQFVALAIWSAAETNVRSYIGDPHAGRSIRRTARLIESRDPERVLTAYREAHPGTDVGIARVVSALTAGATVASQQVAIDWAEADPGLNA